MKFYPTYVGSTLCACDHQQYLHNQVTHECSCCMKEILLVIKYLLDGVGIVNTILKQQTLFESERTAMAQWREQVEFYLDKFNTY